MYSKEFQLVTWYINRNGWAYTSMPLLFCFVSFLFLFTVGTDLVRWCSESTHSLNMRTGWLEGAVETVEETDPAFYR